MKLEALSLAHFGGFEQLDITFEPDVTLIAGVNGVGKSTVLHALAVLLSRALPEFTPSRSAPLYFTDDDIHGDKASLEVSARIQIDGQIINAGVQRLRAADEKGDRFMLLRQAELTAGATDFAQALSARTLTGELEAGVKETRAALASLKSAAHPPLAVYFSPKRRLPGQPRIRATPEGMKIEHWQCQADHPARQLDFSNLHGACLGGHGRPEREQHCDTRKGNNSLCFSVCDPAHPIERQIRFVGDGTIKADDAVIDEALNTVLNLNLPRLVNNRKAVLAAFQQRLQNGRRLDPVRELPKWDGSEPGDLPEFAQVVVYWLRKKQARAAV